MSATAIEEALSPHEKCVRAWLATAQNSISDDDDWRISTLFLIGLRAIWKRALPTLGPVMLTTIFERVFALAQARHAGLTRVGLRIHERTSVEMLTPTALTADLAAAVPSTLAELLEVLDQLTAQSLTPVLHSALSATALDGSGRARGEVGQ